jgi:hypothetical protein
MICFQIQLEPLHRGDWRSHDVDDAGSHRRRYAGFHPRSGRLHYSVDNPGRAVQVANIKTRIESAYGISA